MLFQNRNAGAYALVTDIHGRPGHKTPDLFGALPQNEQRSCRASFDRSNLAMPVSRRSMPLYPRFVAAKQPAGKLYPDAE